MSFSVPRKLDRVGGSRLLIATLDTTIFGGAFNPVTTGSIPTGSGAGSLMTITPELGGITLYNVTAETRIGTDSAPNFVWPYGPSLTAAQAASVFQFESGQSNHGGTAGFTDDDTGARTWVVGAWNDTGSNQSFFIRIKLYGLFFQAGL